jgi:hypothetical protein
MPARRRFNIDLSLVLLIMIALVILLLITFELWIPHGPGHVE